jgi:ArsR family transcriptional regulator
MPPAGASTAALDIARASRLFHALSDGTRIEILRCLAGGERCVCELSGDLDAAQSRLSFHLKTLKDAGIVSDRREGRWVYYTLNREALEDMEAVLDVLKRRAPGRAPSCC